MSIADHSDEALTLTLSMLLREGNYRTAATLIIETAASRPQIITNSLRVLEHLEQGDYEKAVQLLLGKKRNGSTLPQRLRQPL